MRLSDIFCCGPDDHRLQSSHRIGFSATGRFRGGGRGLNRPAGIKGLEETGVDMLKKEDYFSKGRNKNYLSAFEAACRLVEVLCCWGCSKRIPSVGTDFTLEW